MARHEHPCNRPGVIPSRYLIVDDLNVVFIVLSTFVANFWQAVVGIGLIAAGVPLFFVFRALERFAPRAARTDDESLAEADSYVRAMFERSLARPMLVRERPPKRTGRRG